MISLPWQAFLLVLAGWINRKQQRLIEYLLEERRILLEQVGGKSKLHFTDKQRRRLAGKAKRVARKTLMKDG